MSINGKNGCQTGSERRVGSQAQRIVTMQISDPALRVIGGHQHRKDHVMTLHTGVVKVLFRDLNSTELRQATLTRPGDSLNIPATSRHWVIALSDDVCFSCVFVRQNLKGELWQEGDQEDLEIDLEDPSDHSDPNDAEVDSQANQIVALLGL